jgi:rhodanese-related sulfurtransferase
LIPQLPPHELKAWLDDSARPAPLVLDVREPWEHGVCSIAGSRLIPMQEIPVRVAELPRERDIVVLCHHGMRSLQVAAFLARAGFDKVLNLAGGIAAWAEQVEPSMARY